MARGRGWASTGRGVADGDPQGRPLGVDDGHVGLDPPDDLADQPVIVAPPVLLGPPGGGGGLSHGYAAGCQWVGRGRSGRAEVLHGRCGWPTRAVYCKCDSVIYDSDTVVLAFDNVV